MSRNLFPMLLFHEVCHSSKIYLLIDGLKLENGILKEVGSKKQTNVGDKWQTQPSSDSHTDPSLFTAQKDRYSTDICLFVCLFVWFLTMHQPLWVISVRRYQTKHDEDGKSKNL